MHRWLISRRRCAGYFRPSCPRGVVDPRVVRHLFTLWYTRCPMGVGFAHEWLDICSPIVVLLYMGIQLILGLCHLLMAHRSVEPRGWSSMSKVSPVAPPGLSLPMALVVFLRPCGTVLDIGSSRDTWREGCRDRGEADDPVVMLASSALRLYLFILVIRRAMMHPPWSLLCALCTNNTVRLLLGVIC